MNSVIKKDEMVCPRCGNETPDVEDCSWHDKEFYIYLSCKECSSSWREVYRLTYEGYAYEDDALEKMKRAMPKIILGIS